MCAGGTVFPEGLALGSSWDLGLFEAVYAATAREARAIGVHQVFTLVVEPNRDPRLGRNQEGYSEDPWLVSRIAETIVRAVQGEDVSRPDKAVAGLCHYPGQSQPASGLERGAMEISERMLRETFLPPWVAGIRGAGALGVMATYPAIDGVPVHASEKILTRILRDELGFEGLVLSEGGGLFTLLYEGLAPTMKEAGALALRAGVDVGISYEDAYMGALVESVRSGVVPEALVDRAVRRILRQKLRREPTPEELSQLTGLSVDVVQSLAALNTGDVRLDAPMDPDGDRSLIERFVADEMPDTEEEAMNRFLNDEIEHALSTLPPRDAKVLRLYFGLEGGREHTLEEIGSMLGVTRERVRQLRDRALKRLREGDVGRALGSFAA